MIRHFARRAAATVSASPALLRRSYHVLHQELFPGGGTAVTFEHDRGVDETVDEYALRCKAQVEELQKSCPDGVVLFAAPTVGATQATTESEVAEGIERMVTAFRATDESGRKKLDPAILREVIPGHLAAYGPRAETDAKDDNYLSHRLRPLVKGEPETSEVMLADIKTEFEHNTVGPTYVIVVPADRLDCSPREARELAKPYGLSAGEGEKDSCATSGYPLKGLDFDQATINPLGTLHRLVVAMAKEAPPEDRAQYVAAIVNCGLNKTLLASSLDYLHTKQAQATLESEGSSLPTPGE